jgi:N-acetylglutamate synthase-like GNAT family acetyltransferase
MVIRLHNLSARAPTMADVHAVAELFRVCEHAEPLCVDAIEYDIRQNWQLPGFLLKQDAWVIVTNKGQIVGYADLRRKSDQTQCEFILCLRVHPTYLERGLGTLLIWLVEERARQLMQDVAVHVDVTLCSHVSSLDQWACKTFEREGYTSARRFWRLIIALEASSTGLSRHSQLTVDVVIDADGMIGGDVQEQRTDMYIARQYEIYKKVLRTGKTCEEINVLVTHGYRA